jgi:hypothetical protein
LAQAAAGRQAPLFDRLTRGSRLPGARMNEELAEAFAQACQSAGPRADAVAVAMARLSPDEAPGATAREFLPVCGILAIGARAAGDASVRAKMLAELHSHADDLRFRVRDAVVDALASIGAVAGDALVADIAPWMDGYFHAAAVLRALATAAWLASLHEANPVVARLDEAFTLAHDAPRAAARWPGHKALVEALGQAPVPIAVRFGVPVFDALVRWAATQHPALEEAVRTILRSKKLAGRLKPEADRVHAALVAHRPAPRNPDHDVGRTRDRSRTRRRG